MYFCTYLETPIFVENRAITCSLIIFDGEQQSSGKQCNNSWNRNFNCNHRPPDFFHHTIVVVSKKRNSSSAASTSLSMASTPPPSQSLSIPIAMAT
mmetsp:Transcript_23707/g.51290  ORF Transcript_23707/g.51290 Transcript_23707/m.51290 type:complete len:96 (-) Transcript_23707:186-473(-)